MDTQEIKRAGGKVYAVFEKLLVGLMIFFVVWMFDSINALQDEIAEMRNSRKENKAQWGILHQHSKKLVEQEIEQEVTKRVFAMLLRQNKIDLGQLTLPRLDEIPEPPRQQQVEEFRTEQMELNEPMQEQRQERMRK